MTTQHTPEVAHRLRMAGDIERLRALNADLLAALEDATDLNETYLSMVGDCEHDVGICGCKEKERIRQHRAAIAKAKEELK